jgi:hypothetical protein
MILFQKLYFEEVAGPQNVNKEDVFVFYNVSVAVTVNCHKGKFFSLYAFNEFSTSLADARLQKGDFAAFRSAIVEENTRYRIEKDCHDLQARIGIPPQTGAKIFFIRKSQIIVSVLVYMYA